MPGPRLRKVFLQSDLAVGRFYYADKGAGFANVHVETLPWGIRDGGITCCLCGKVATTTHGAVGQHVMNIKLWCAFAKGRPPMSLGPKGTMDDIGDNLKDRVVAAAKTHPKLCLPPRELSRVLEAPIKAGDFDETRSVRECCENYCIREYCRTTNRKLDRMAMVVQGVTLVLGRESDISASSSGYCVYYVLIYKLYIYIYVFSSII